MATLKPIIFLEFLEDTAQFILWLDVPVARRILNPRAESAYPDVSAAELQAIRTGEVRERIVNATTWADVVNLRVQRQLYLDTQETLFVPGAYWDGVTVVLPTETPDPEETPLVFIGPATVSQITTTTAVVDADVNLPGLFKAQYGIGNFSTETSLTSGASPNFLQALSGLTENSQYTLRVYAETASDPVQTTLSGTVTFTTANSLPVFLLGPGTSQLTSTSVVVTATADQATTMTVGIAEVATPTVIVTFGPTASAATHSLTLTGLAPDTAYQWSATLSDGTTTVTSNLAMFTTTAITPIPTGTEIPLLLGGPDGTIYSVNGETDTTILGFVDLIDAQFWRRATYYDPVTQPDPGYAIDIFVPGMPTMTYQNARLKMVTQGGGDDAIRHAYWLYYATGNEDYRRAAWRLGEVAINDPNWITPGYPSIAGFANYICCARGWALIALDHPTASVRTTARTIVRQYAYLAAKSRNGDFFDAREASHELQWILCAHILGMNPITPTLGYGTTTYDTFAVASRKVDYVLSHPTNSTKSQQSDGAWLHKKDGTGAGMTPIVTFDADTTIGSKVITWAAGPSIFADIKTNLTITGSGIPGGIPGTKLRVNWVVTVTTAAASADVTRTGGAANSADMIGQPITGPGIPAGATVSNVVGAVITISAPATATSTTGVSVTVLAKNPADSTFLLTQAATATATVTCTAGGMPDTIKRSFMDGELLEMLAWYARIFPNDKARCLTALTTAYRDATPGPIGWYAKRRDVDGSATGGAPLDYANVATQLTPAYVYDTDGDGNYTIGTESATEPAHYASLNAWHISALGWLHYETSDAWYKTLARELLTGMISTETTGRRTGGGVRELAAPHWKTFNQFGEATQNLGVFRTPAIPSTTLTIDVSDDQEATSTRHTGWIVSMSPTWPPDTDIAPLRPKWFREALGQVHSPAQWPPYGYPAGCLKVHPASIYQRILGFGGWPIVNVAQDYMFLNGGGNMQAPWPGDGGDWSRWDNFITSIAQQSIVDARTYWWEIWAEPNLWGYWQVGETRFRETWRRAHTILRSILPSVVILGPCPVPYTSSYMESFLLWAQSNNVLPSIISWHEQNSPDAPWNIPAHATSLRAFLALNNINITQFAVTEYGRQYVENKPGLMLCYQWGFETAGIQTACLSAWQTLEAPPDPSGQTFANGRLGGDVTYTGGRRAGWWVKKWRADVAIPGGTFVKVTNTDDLYGLASKDAVSSTVQALIGNAKNLGLGAVSIGFTNLPTAYMPDTTTLDVVVESIPFTSSAIANPTSVQTTTAVVAGNAVTVTLANVTNYQAYKIRLTPAGSPPSADLFDIETQISATQGQNNWRYLTDNGTNTQNVPMTWSAADSRWVGTASNTFIAYYAAQAALIIHPGATVHSKIRFTVPRTKTITVAVQVQKYDNTGGDGVIVTVLHNTTTKATLTVTNNEAAETYGASFAAVAGDTIDLVVDAGAANTNSYDSTHVQVFTVSVPQ